MDVFVLSFFILSFFCFIIYFFGGNRVQSLNEAGLRKFQGQYLLVYVLAQGIRSLNVVSIVQVHNGINIRCTTGVKCCFKIGNFCISLQS